MGTTVTGGDENHLESNWVKASTGLLTRRISREGNQFGLFDPEKTESCVSRIPPRSCELQRRQALGLAARLSLE